MTLLWRHRLGALVLALLLHAGIGAALGWHIAPPPAAGTGTGEHGIEIALGSVSAAAGSVDSVASAASATEAPPPPDETAPAAEATPERASKTTADIALSRPAVVAKSIPVANVPSPAADQTPEPVSREAIPVAPPQTASSPESSQAAAHPVPKPRRKPPAPAPEQTAAPANPLNDRPAPEQSVASVAGAGGKSGSDNRGSRETERASTGPSGASGAVAADYYALIRGWLEKHKEYPRRAKRRRQQGTAMLFFVLARDGSVLDYRIRRSSGFKILDSEVEDMIRRAQPLPPMPGEFKQSRLELVVPIEFSIR